MNEQKEYFAVKENWSQIVVSGTLDKILQEIIDSDEDPEDFKFFPAESEVKVKYERKLTLLED